MSYRTVIRPQPERLLQAATAAPGRILQAIARTMDLENERLISQIVRQRLTGQGPFDPSQNRLGVRTNRLRSSLRRSNARVEGANVVSSIGSNVAYLAAHEFGFDGDVTVRAHTRQLNTLGGRPVNQQRLRRAQRRDSERGQIGSKQVEVRSHQRRLRLPARAPIRTEISARAQAYQAALAAAVQRAIKQGIGS